MSREYGFGPSSTAYSLGVFGVLPQRSDQLSAYPLNRFFVETRLGQRQPQKVEGLISLDRECSQSPRIMITTGRE